MTRNTALHIVAVVLLLLLALNTYWSISFLTRIQRTDALVVANSAAQGNIARVQQDLTDMQTAQRGYLLTENPQYLEPYQQAKARIATDFGELRSSLASRSEQERSQASQIESLAASEQAELERAITLRQHGYRRLAFNAVDTNKDKEYMDQIRGLITSLSTAETSSSGEFNKGRSASLGSALSVAIVMNLVLLALATCLFGLSRDQGQELKQEATRSQQLLALRDSQLKEVASALNSQAHSSLSSIDSNAAILLDTYGGFLPKHAQESAQQIREAAAHMEKLRSDLLANLGKSA
jgi:CHASE3 domain sensor protein